MKFLKFFLPFTFVLIFFQTAEPQEIFQPSGRSQALAETYVPLSDSWSVFGNPAGMSGAKNLVIGVSFQNRFLVSELSSKAVFLQFPVSSSVFALSFYQFGQIPFRQEKLGFAYARSLGTRLNFGVQFNYYSLFLAEENRSAKTAGLEIGFLYLANDNLTLGFHLINPYQTGIRLSSQNYTFDSVAALGLSYRLSDFITFVCEFEERFDQAFKVKSGLEYVIHDKVSIRAGISGKPYKLSGGAGFCFGAVTLDFAASYHQYLGNSPSVSFAYHF